MGTLRPTFIANLRASWNRYVEGSRGDGNKGFSPTQLGFPASLINQLPLPDWFGRYEFSQYISLGRYFSFNYTNGFAIHPTITWINGSHTIKTGVDYRLIVYNQHRPGNPFRLTADRGWTQREFNRGDALSGNSIASFLLGTPNGGGIDYNLNPSTVQTYVAPYIQDDWKLTRKLTLNLGIRIDFNTSPFERYDRLNRSFDPAITNPADKLIDRTQFSGFPTVRGSLLFADVNGVPRRASNLDITTIQPRAGFAYQLNMKTVLRGGIGRYYFNPNNDYLQFNGFDQSTPIITSLNGSRTPIATLLSNPFPDGVGIPPGASQGALTFLGRGFSFFDPTFKVPYVHQFSLGFQRELPYSSSVDVSYVANRTYKLETNWDYNEPSLAFRKQCNPLEGGNPNFCDALLPNPFYNLAPWAGTGLGSSPTTGRFGLQRPFPGFGGITQRGRNDGRLWYNSLQVTYQLRGRGGLNISAAYTLSKTVEQWGWNDAPAYVVQRGLYNVDRPHVVKMGAVWELPFGRGRKFLNTTHPVWSRVFSGWQNTAIFQYSSGRPWDLPGGVQYLREAKIGNIDWSSPQVRGIRPCVARYNSDGTITAQPYSVSYGCGSDLSTYNFLIQPRYAPRQTPLRDGRLRLHSVPQMDLSINKTTRITERWSVQFRGEAFNFFNTFWFQAAQFNNNPDDSNFGSIIKATVAQGSANFPRQVQLAVKIIF
ncbi:MAG: hypothetical protein HY235_24450 [Acidobacteria bacterium]|nr:hypothetical protein [Acidobacteriota bacterium]